MVLKMYSIRDAKSESFSPPFYKITHGLAERDFKMLVNNPENNISKFPEDYDLWHMGEFEDNTGKVSPLDTPLHMMKAVQVLEPQN